MIIAIAVVGGVAVFVTWRLVARGKASVWVAVGLVEVAAALAALVARAPPLSPRIAPGWTALAGFGSGSVAETVAELSNAPAAVIVAVTLMVTFAPEARLAIVHGSAAQPPPLTVVMLRFVGVSVT